MLVCRLDAQRCPSGAPIPAPHRDRRCLRAPLWTGPCSIAQLSKATSAQTSEGTFVRAVCTGVIRRSGPELLEPVARYYAGRT